MIKQKLIDEYNRCLEEISKIDTVNDERYYEKYMRITHYMNGVRFGLDLFEKEDQIFVYPPKDKPVKIVIEDPRCEHCLKHEEELKKTLKENEVYVCMCSNCQSRYMVSSI